jgi:hypothetical protein
MCAGFESIFVGLLLLKTIQKEDFEMDLQVLKTRKYCRRGINWMVVPNHLPTNCTLLPAKFPKLKVWNEIYIFIQSRDNRWRWNS